MAKKNKQRFVCPACGVPKLIGVHSQRLVRLKAEALAATEYRNIKLQRLYAILDEIEAKEAELEELAKKEEEIKHGIYDALTNKIRP